MQLAVDSGTERGAYRVECAQFLHFLQREPDVFAGVPVESASALIRRSDANYPLRAKLIHEALGDKTGVLGSYIVVDDFEK